MKHFWKTLITFAMSLVLTISTFAVTGEITVHADGELSLGVNDVKKGTLSKAKSTDIYQMNVPSDGYLKIEVTGENKCFTTLYDSDRNKMGSLYIQWPRRREDATQSNEYSLYAGTYYLETESDGFNDSDRKTENYTIRTSFEAAGNNQTSHTNHDEEHAVPIQLGQTVSTFGATKSSGFEYYSLNLTAPARLRITFTSDDDGSVKVSSDYKYQESYLHTESGKRGAPQTKEDVFVADIGRHYFRVTNNEGKASFTINNDAEVTMYRAYNPNSGEHFYTSNRGEFNHIVSLGWHNEGVGWIAPKSSKTPVYRLYNKNGGEHHYTIDNHERSGLIMQGWTDEGIGWYSDDLRTVPLYRQYNPNAFANNHNYTTSKSENNYLVSLGWRAEGIGWYGIRAK